MRSWNFRNAALTLFRLRVYHRGTHTYTRMHVQTCHAARIRITHDEAACSGSTTPIGNDVYFCNYRVAYGDNSATISDNIIIWRK